MIRAQCSQGGVRRRHLEVESSQQTSGSHSSNVTAIIDYCKGWFVIKGGEEKGAKEPVTDKKEVVFDPADYAYMDSMPLEGWVWEFMRRDPRFQEHYRKNVLPLNTGTANVNCTFVFGNCPLPLCMNDPALKWSDGVQYSIWYGVSQLDPVCSLNLKWGLRRDIKGEKTEWVLVPLSEVHRTVKDDDSELLSYLPDNTIPMGHPCQQLSTLMGKENVIMALIDISSPVAAEELLEKIKHDILMWRKLLKLRIIRSPKKPKKTPNALVGTGTVWKDYLIIYDLAAQGVSVPQIQTMLYKHDKAHYRLTDTVRKKLKAATEMIDGGYQKYFVA